MREGVGQPADLKKRLSNSKELPMQLRTSLSPLFPRNCLLAVQDVPGGVLGAH